jgi:outer membrane immunogenic protein
MKKVLFLSALSSVPLMGAAGAADLPLKAPSGGAPAALSWTGFYLGGGVGFRSSEANESSVLLKVGSFPASPPMGAANTEPLNGIAHRGDLFAGYNWQASSRWVVGIEGDVGLTDRKTTFAGIAFPDQTLATLGAADGIAAKTSWDASARGRVGFLIAPTTLVFATGGAAWQRYEISTSCGSVFCASTFGLTGVTPSLTPAVTNNATTRTGWTVGGGIETALGGSWFARADYRYADFGNTTFTISRSTTFLFLNPIVNTFDVSLRTHAATFGIAYKFGEDPSGPSAGWFDQALPVKALPAKTPAIPSWNGFYAGLGLGLRASRTEATTTTEIFGLFGPVALTGLPIRQPLNGTAFRGAPYLGVNWQIGPRLVAGIEADFGFADQTTSLSGLSFAPGVFLNSGTAGDSFAVRTKWDASTRGRIGLLVTPATLAYATAGAAWQHFDVTSPCDLGGGIGCGGLTPAVIANSATKAGWTVGGGLETMLSGNWFARAEYRYADFGTSSFSLNRQGLITNFDVALHTQTATFGITYKFGSFGGEMLAAH